jgi:hypothetical protein
VNALAAACNENPGWTPLPRGASFDMPTVGSREGLVATVPPAPAPVSQPVAKPVAQPVAQPVPWQRPETKPPSNVVRNVMIAAATVVALAAGGYIALRNFDSPQSTEVTTKAPAPAPAAEEVPAPAAVALPPPVVAEAPPRPQTDNAAAARLPLAPKESSFQLTTSPAGATAVFDNDPAQPCTTPCTRNLPAGRHTIVLNHSGYRESLKIIDTPRDPGLIVDMLPLEGTFSLVTNPAGLKVLIDGKEHAQKTPLSVTLSAGKHEIQVINGNDKRDFPVEIKDGQIKSQTVEWGQ